MFLNPVPASAAQCMYVHDAMSGVITSDGLPLTTVDEETVVLH